MLENKRNALMAKCDNALQLCSCMFILSNKHEGDSCSSSWYQVPRRVSHYNVNEARPEKTFTSEEYLLCSYFKCKKISYMTTAYFFKHYAITGNKKNMCKQKDQMYLFCHYSSSANIDCHGIPGNKKKW